jgi:hypothetical protein
MNCLYCGEPGPSQEYYDIDPRWWYAMAKRHIDGSCARTPTDAVVEVVTFVIVMGLFTLVGLAIWGLTAVLS